MNRRTLLPFQGWRIIFFRAIAVSMLLVLVVRTWQLQFVQGAELKADADENRFQTLPIPASRGAIFDRNGTALALNDPAFIVNVVPADLPEDFNDTLDVYNRLSALVDVPATRAIADAAGRTDERSIDELVREGEGIAPFRPVPIAADVDQDIAKQILEERQSLPGVYVEYRAVRNYPTDLTTAQLVGYLGPIPEDRAQELRELGYNPAFDRIGYAGIERYLEVELAGRNGQETYEVDVAGEPVRLVERVAPTSGVSVQLTLDLELQQAAQQALINRINALNAQEQRLVSQSGVVIAMNPQTGEILALVSWPTYDNSRFARSIDVDYYLDLAASPLRPFVNHGVQSLYPPGSVWKIITSVAVVEEDVIDPFQTLFDGGELILPNAFAPNDEGRGQRFVCWLRSGHGSQNLIDAIANSCDVYFYQVGGGNPDVSPAILREGGLGIKDLYRWATAFGVGSQTGIELPLENDGRMPEPQWKRRLYGESWSTGDTYNAAFGQGYLTVTPLQLLNAVASVINGGNLLQPTLLKNFQDANGNILQEFEPRVARTIIPPDDGPMVLLLQEDMLIQEANSLACRCEPSSDYYDPGRCNASTYIAQFDANPDEDIDTWIDYTVHLPYGFEWSQSFVCDPLSFNILREQYIPPMATRESLDLTVQGMREVITRGTASASVNTAFPPLTNVNEGGKTGTAEYCDDVAFPQGLCIPGRWPSHAWYTGFAPVENPEIIVIAFVYNAGEGSQWAMPVVRQVLDYYFNRTAISGPTPVILPPDEEDTPPDDTEPAAPEEGAPAPTEEDGDIPGGEPAQ